VFPSTSSFLTFQYRKCSSLFIKNSKGFAEAPKKVFKEKKEEKQIKNPFEAICYRFRSFPVLELFQPTHC
jgi:hypothetical protein